MRVRVFWPQGWRLPLRTNIHLEFSSPFSPEWHSTARSHHLRRKQIKISFKKTRERETSNNNNRGDTAQPRSHHGNTNTNLPPSSEHTRSPFFNDEHPTPTLIEVINHNQYIMAVKTKKKQKNKLIIKFKKLKKYKGIWKSFVTHLFHYACHFQSKRLGFARRRWVLPFPYTLVSILQACILQNLKNRAKEKALAKTCYNSKYAYGSPGDQSTRCTGLNFTITLMLTQKIKKNSSSF